MTSCYDHPRRPRSYVRVCPTTTLIHDPRAAPFATNWWSLSVFVLGTESHDGPLVMRLELPPADIVPPHRGEQCDDGEAGVRPPPASVHTRTPLTTPASLSYPSASPLRFARCVRRRARLKHSACSATWAVHIRPLSPVKRAASWQEAPSWVGITSSLYLRPSSLGPTANAYPPPHPPRT